MTNNEIIFENVRASFTPAQLAELVQATYTAEQIAARRSNVTMTRAVRTPPRTSSPPCSPPISSTRSPSGSAWATA